MPLFHQQIQTKNLGGNKGSLRRIIKVAVLLLSIWIAQNNFHAALKISYLDEEEPTLKYEWLYEYMYNQRRALINESSVIDLQLSEDSIKHPTGSGLIGTFFGNEIKMVTNWKEIMSLNETARNSYLEDFANPDSGDLLCGRLCDTIQLFRQTNGMRPHVLISHLNENWGAFSTPVPNRTVNWGEWEGHFKREGCTTEDLWWYLNHTNVSAIFTTTHQWLDHPKVFSLPLGIKHQKGRIVEDLTTIQKNMTLTNRTELLLIAQSAARDVITEHVIANFNGTIKNKYKDGSDYIENLRNAKFILSPSGMGWDCYRTWEALCMGTIPVLETYYRKDGLYRSFDDLPVLWVDHYDNVTPSLLEASYPQILAKAKEYNFAKLTNQWWVDFINSFRNDSPTPGNQSFAQAYEEDLNVQQQFTWMDTTGVTLSHIQGDPSTCADVVYTGSSLDPFNTNRDDENQTRIIQHGWKSLTHLARHSLVLKNTTCFVFFKIDSPWIDQSGRELHPVWGRLPATSLVMSAFSKAEVFLYIDSDALLAFPDKTPTSMYNILAYDGYGENATLQHLTPGLVVNKPLTGWLCGECEKFGLGHGCFNSGALLWHRSKAELVLRAWWESRILNETKNLYEPKSSEYFHGWSGDHRLGYKMGEQNRLMYVYATDPEVRGAVWPVPRQKSDAFNSESCPNAVDETHTPCLQSDFMKHVKWNSSEPSCFISHYADDKKLIIDHAKAISN
jgi:hypothetical protein